MKFGPGQNQVQNQVFFVIFSSLVQQFSFKLHYDDRLEQCLTTSRAKTRKKKFGPNRPKPDPKFFFFVIFSSLVHQFSFKFHQDDSLEQCLTTSRGKTCKKSLGTQIQAKQTKIGPKVKFFCHFFKFNSLVFLKISQDDSLEHCLTTNYLKVKPMKKPMNFAIFSRLHHQFSLIAA